LPLLLDALPAFGDVHAIDPTHVQVFGQLVGVYCVEDMFPQQVTEVTTTLLPQAEVALIADTNHMLPLQDPDALGEAVASFVRRHPIGAVV
jgi:pimeloyl-ACP methyl ester carboxylesterase